MTTPTTTTETFTRFSASCVKLAAGITDLVRVEPQQYDCLSGRTIFYAEFQLPGQELPTRSPESTSPRQALNNLKGALSYQLRSWAGITAKEREERAAGLYQVHARR